MGDSVVHPNPQPAGRLVRSIPKRVCEFYVQYQSSIDACDAEARMFADSAFGPDNYVLVPGDYRADYDMSPSRRTFSCWYKATEFRPGAAPVKENT